MSINVIWMRNERQVVADWLGVRPDELPSVEAGYRMVARGDQQSSEVVINAPGTYTVMFAEIASSFGGYRPLLVEGPV